LISDGLRPAQAAKIKIYVCEEGIAQTKKISENLIEALGTAFGNTDVYNYTKEVTIPKKSPAGVHKYAGEVDLGAKHGPKITVFGRASKFRKVTNVARFFKQKDSEVKEVEGEKPTHSKSKP
jgi:hypothetical protein